MLELSCHHRWGCDHCVVMCRGKVLKIMEMYGTDSTKDRPYEVGSKYKERFEKIIIGICRRPACMRMIRLGNNVVRETTRGRWKSLLREFVRIDRLGCFTFFGPSCFAKVSNMNCASVIISSVISNPIYKLYLYNCTKPTLSILRTFPFSFPILVDGVALSATVYLRSHSARCLLSCIRMTSPSSSGAVHFSHMCSSPSPTSVLQPLSRQMARTL